MCCNARAPCGRCAAGRLSVCLSSETILYDVLSCLPPSLEEMAPYVTLRLPGIALLQPGWAGTGPSNRALRQCR